MSLSMREGLSCADIDAVIVRLARRKGELELEIGRWLLMARRARVDRDLGFGSFDEYAERRLGLDARTTREHLRIAEALEALPRLAALMKDGERSWSAVREITRVATAETEERWIAETEGKTVREVERLVSGRKSGDLPDAPRDPLLTRRKIVFDVSPEVFAMMREAVDVLAKQIGSPTPDDVVRAMAEHVLGRRPDEDAAAYQVGITMCATCQRTWRNAGGEAVEVSESVADCASCDGDVTGMVAVDEGVVEEAPPQQPQPATHVGHELADVVHRAVEKDGWKAFMRSVAEAFGSPELRSMTPRIRALVLTRDRRRCSVPGFM